MSAIDRLLSEQDGVPSTIDQERVARIMKRMDSALEVCQEDREFILDIQKTHATWLLTKINQEKMGRA